MVHMVLYTTIISVLITGIWCHDLLFFDEFEYTFDLNNANDWEHYFINTNIDNNDYSSLSKQSSKTNEYINKLYQNEQIINKDKNLFSKLNYAKTCTQTIPLILKQLCVHWKHDQGFKYNYQTPTYSSQIEDTNWYYNNDNNNLQSDAATADKYYSLLDNNIRYIGDDSNWNEINYANSLSSFTMDNDNNNNYFKNFAKGSFKQCKHSIRMRECVQFHLPSKKLTVHIKVARARKHNYKRRLYDYDTDEYENENEYEYDDEYGYYDGYYDGYYGDDSDSNSAYDFHGQFEYGDSMGYDNWSADKMQWKSFMCLDCMNDRRRLYDEYYDNDMEDVYDKYGDYTYLFNEYALDFDNDDDWYDVSNDGKLKCSIAIPGFEHKLCVDLSRNMNEDNNGAKISFAAANDDDIDYGYYDIYGYDQYYYNIDHLYKHRRRIMDSDSDEYYIDDEQMQQYNDAIEQGDYGDDEYDDEYDENYEYMQQYKGDIGQEYYGDNDEDEYMQQYNDASEQEYYDDNEYDEDEYMQQYHDAIEQEYNGDDDYDYLFGDEEYDENYAYMEQYYDAIDQEYIMNLRNELSDISLNFLDDNLWNDITTIYDELNNKYLRKCKSFEVSQLCAIHSLSNPNEAIKLQLKIGKYKFHRSQNQKDTFASNINYINIYDDDSDENNENENENQQQEHWIISDEILDLDNDEWNDESLWNPSQDQILTNMLEKIVAMRCRSHTYCLCQYVDKSFDGGRKHPCAKGKINEPQRVVHVMDDFVKTPKSEFIPLHDYHKSPLRIEFHYKPHIEHLHVVGGLPFFHRRNHRKRHMIPWYKYSRYESLRPKSRPKWLPHWMWREIGAHIHHDPRQVQRIMKSLRHKGLLTPKLGGNTKGKYVKQGGLMAQLKKTGNKAGKWFKKTSNKAGKWFKKTGNKMGNWFKDKFSANDMDSDYYNDENEDLYYYEYDENLADELDDMTDNSDASNMVKYMFPIMEDSTKYVQPLLESMNDMVGNTWNKLAESVGIRRRMEEYNDEIYEYNDEYIQNENENMYGSQYGYNDGYYASESYDYNTENNIIDNWYDEDDGSNWIMLSDELSDDTLYEIQNAEESDKIIKNIITSSGKQVKRQCMRIFGRKLCICQFLKFINAQKADHFCFPKQKSKKYHVPMSFKKKLLISLNKKKQMKKMKLRLLKLKQKKFKRKPIKLKPKKLKPKPVKLKQKLLKIKHKMQQKLKSKPLKLKPKIKKLKAKSKISKLKKALGLRKKLRKHGLKPKVIKKQSKRRYKPLISKITSKPYKLKIKKSKFIKENVLKKRKGPKRYKLWKGKKNKKRINIPRDNKARQDWIMKESNKIRKIVKSGLPNDRPLWFPHYFWHWLHSAPHFHVLRHKRRVPWVASSAKMDVDMNNAAKSLDYNFYQYGEDSEVDYNAVIEDMYDSGYDNAMVDDYGDVIENDMDEYEDVMDDIYDGNMDDFEENYYEENGDDFDGVYDENDVDFEEDYYENDDDIYGENDMDFEGEYYEENGDVYDGNYNGYEDVDLQEDYADIYDENEDVYDGNYGGYEVDNNEDELVMNALENGNDFIGKEDDINNEMWKIETMFLFMIISLLFCILTFCFVWRSKWGALIRKLNQQRINRNKMIYEAKKRMEILNDIDSDDDNDVSSSLNISDVAPLNNNYNNDV